MLRQTSIDEIKITVESGSGGRGCESYHVRSDHKRSPDGGDGGRGGDIIFRSDENVTSFDELGYRQHFEAPAGEAGQGNKRAGRNAPPIIVKVPCGTLITNEDTGLRIRDLTVHGDEVVVAAGGLGGSGNHHNGACRPPESGVVVHLYLVFKISSDAVLLGLPNSGKSMLLNRLTRAKVKSDVYPFSTTTPQLGVLRLEDFRQIKLCELPGILERAHQGKGLGNKFLRHLSCTRLIVLVLDPYDVYKISIRRAYEILLEEMRRFDERLEQIPRLVVINKADQPDFSERMKKAVLSCAEPVLFVSAQTGEGIEELKKKLEELIL